MEPCGNIGKCLCQQLGRVVACFPSRRSGPPPACRCLLTCDDLEGTEEREIRAQAGHSRQLSLVLPAVLLQGQVRPGNRNRAVTVADGPPPPSSPLPPSWRGVTREESQGNHPHCHHTNTTPGRERRRMGRQGGHGRRLGQLRERLEERREIDLRYKDCYHSGPGG